VVFVGDVAFGVNVFDPVATCVGAEEDYHGGLWDHLQDDVLYGVQLLAFVGR